MDTLPKLTDKQKALLDYFLGVAIHYGRRHRAYWYETARGKTVVAQALVEKGLLEKRDTGNRGHSNPGRVADSGDVYISYCRYEYRLTPKYFKLVREALRGNADQDVVRITLTIRDIEITGEIE